MGGEWGGMWEHRGLRRTVHLRPVYNTVQYSPARPSSSPVTGAPRLLRFHPYWDLSWSRAPGAAPPPGSSPPQGITVETPTSNWIHLNAVGRRCKAPLSGCDHTGFRVPTRGRGERQGTAWRTTVTAMTRSSGVMHNYPRRAGPSVAPSGGGSGGTSQKPNGRRVPDRHARRSRRMKHSGPPNASAWRRTRWRQTAES